MKDYQAYVDRAAGLDFVADPATAEAIVKATLGLLISNLPERAAVEMAAELPRPLDLGELRGHQQSAAALNVESALGVLQNQFAIDQQQARQAASRVLALAREDVGPRKMEQVQRQLPDDWVQLIDRA